MKRRNIILFVSTGALLTIALSATWWGQQYGAPHSRPAIAVLPSMQPTPTNAPDAEPPELSAADQSAIASVIQQQITAFQANDAELAFSLASPEVREKFQTADQFMAMVRAEYETVYRPQSVNFEKIAWVRGNPIQAVTLLGPSGEWMTAYYQMEQQNDKTWRIAGCVLVPMPGETI